MTEAPAAATHQYATFRLTVRTPADDAIRHLRAAIKMMLRRFNLRVTRIEQVGDGGAQ